MPEENSLFHAEYIHDLPTHKEFLKISRQANTINTVIRYLMTGSILFYWILAYVMLDSPESFSKGFLFITAIYLATQLFTVLRGKNGDLQFQRMLFSNGGKPVRYRYSFDAEKIRLHNPDNGNDTSYDYAQIRYLNESEHLLTLEMPHRLCLIISKDTLTGGSFSEFTEFLLSRCTGIRNKKVRRGTAGKLAHWIFAVVIILGIGLAVFHLPAVRRFADSFRPIHNGMSYLQIAQELESMGISCEDDIMLRELEDRYQEYRDYYTADYSKTMDLLSWIGYGDYDPDTWEWTPSTSGVYWFDGEIVAVDTMYTDFLRGICAASKGQLQFTDIREDTSRVNWDQGTGTQAVTFIWNGKNYRLEGEVYYDWFDTQVANELNEILRAQNPEKQLYFAYDGGQGYLVFYCDSQWARTFEKSTGIDLQTKLPVYSDSLFS